LVGVVSTLAGVLLLGKVTGAIERVGICSVTRHLHCLAVALDGERVHPGLRFEFLARRWTRNGRGSRTVIIARPGSLIISELLVVLASCDFCVCGFRALPAVDDAEKSINIHNH